MAKPPYPIHILQNVNLIMRLLKTVIVSLPQLARDLGVNVQIGVFLRYFFHVLYLFYFLGTLEI